MRLTFFSLHGLRSYHCSFHRDSSKGTVETNEFSLNWGGLSGYIFPLFCLILMCLGKIRREKAIVVFVCPVSTSQRWFPLFLELSCDVPRLLNQSQTLLTFGLEEPHPLLASGVLLLGAWNLFSVT